MSKSAPRTSKHGIEMRHKVCRDELITVLRKHGAALSAQEILALASHLVGQLIALQDQRVMTPDMAMRIVTENIEQGNREAIGGILDVRGTA